MEPTGAAGQLLLEVDVDDFSLIQPDAATVELVAEDAGKGDHAEGDGGEGEPGDLAGEV
jgi:hypothetical protein